MPELPEVEMVKRGLNPLILNKKIIQTVVSENKCFIGDGTGVDGAKVINIRRFGKALIIDLDSNYSLMIHLRMTGQLIWRGVEQFAAGHPSKNFIDELPNKQTRVYFEFKDGVLYFNDQRKFGFMKVLLTSEIEQEKFIASLGKEPWDMSVDELVDICSKHPKSPIKTVILDQKLIAGLGNIYADESLFYAKIHPAALAGDLTRPQIAKLLEGACRVMDASIAAGGSTMATYIHPDGTTGNYLDMFAHVYHKNGTPCDRCGTELVKTRLGGRGTHFCPKCQILPTGNQKPAKTGKNAIHRTLSEATERASR